MLDWYKGELFLPLGWKKRYQLQHPGMTCANINRIFVDHASNVWLIPSIDASNFRWWHAIMSLQNDQWKLYNYKNYPEMGPFGDNPNSIGITESRHTGKGSEQWKMWFGFSGGGTKCYLPESDKWSVFSELQQSGTGAPSKFYHNKSLWTKNDAIAQDSSGYIWISFWRNVNNSYNHHALLCYDSEHEPDTEQKDPEKAHFRWFFGVNDIVTLMITPFECRQEETLLLAAGMEK